MKTYRKFNLFILFVASYLLISCDSMLDLKPETEMTEPAFFTKAEDFELTVNYCYTWLDKMITDNGLNGIVQRDYDADIAFYQGSNMTDISMSAYTTSTTDDNYKNYYDRVRHINQIFKNQDRVDLSEIKTYIAEAHFFRAYYSWLFYRDFGPGTINKTVVDKDSPELYSPRDSRDDFADFIIADLEAAINTYTLPKESELPADQIGRITLGAANALLARFCLFEGTWQKYHFNNSIRANMLLEKAVRYAEAVMNDNSYELFYNFDMGCESYRYLFTLESATQCNEYNVLKDQNKEYIFRNRFHENVKRHGHNSVHVVQGVVASRKMIEMHLDKNGQITKPDYVTSYNSFTNNMDPRLGMNFRAPFDLYWSYEDGRTIWTIADEMKLKPLEVTDVGFPNQKFCAERTMGRDNWGIDVPIIRLAEVYLIYAEALYELKGSISDEELNQSINKLRDRVGMIHLTNTNIPLGSDMLTEIRRERSIELYLEGFRYDDLRRWKTAETEMSMSIEGLPMSNGAAYASPRTFWYPAKGENVTYQMSLGGYSIGSSGYVMRQDAAYRKFSEKFYLKPIPTKQIEINPQLKQNEGWDDK